VAEKTISYSNFPELEGSPSEQSCRVAYLEPYRTFLSRGLAVGLQRSSTSSTTIPATRWPALASAPWGHDVLSVFLPAANSYRLPASLLSHNAAVFTARSRHDKVDACGSVTLRYLSRLRHIRLGVVHKNRRVRLLVAGSDLRIVTEDGQLLRSITLDPKRHHDGLGGRWPVHNDVRQVCTMS